MFFSVIIPTYNPRAYLPRLLESISKNDCLEEIEVIVSDDCSKEWFKDIFHEFPQLNIRTIVNDRHYGFPRNGRENGAQEAHGKWICFADQDDFFIDHAFDNIKKHIEEHGASNYIAANFIKLYANTGERELISGLCGWTHGKFFEKTFWDNHDIHYENIEYCEDTNLSTLVQCIMIDENKYIRVIDNPVYVWYRRSDSLADDDYFAKSFPDYIRATFGVILPFVEKHATDRNQTMFGNFTYLYLKTLLHLYFYSQALLFRHEKKAMIEAMAFMFPYHEQFRNIVGCTNQDIAERMKSDLFSLYCEARDNDCKQISFVEQMSFDEFLRWYL